MVPPVFPRSPEAASVRLLPLAVVLWLGYGLVFFVVDQQYISRAIPAAYYLLTGGAGVLVLVLAGWSAAPAALGRAFLPLVIALMTVPPIIVNHVLLPRFPGGPAQQLPGPTLSAEGVTLRLLPVLLLALVLTA